MPLRFRLLLVNRLAEALIAYPVDLDTGRRMPLAERIPPHGGRLTVDVQGEPLALQVDRDVVAGAEPNGCYVAWDRFSEPALIQVQVLHYKVVPGAAGSDLTKQPIVLSRECFEARTGPHRLTLEPGFKLGFR